MKRSTMSPLFSDSWIDIGDTTGEETIDGDGGGSDWNNGNFEGSANEDFSNDEEDLVEDGADLWLPVSEEDDPPPSLPFSASSGPECTSAYR